MLVNKLFFVTPLLNSVADPDSDPQAHLTIQDPDPFSGCLGFGSGSGSVSYSNGTTKLTGKFILTQNTFCVGPVGPTDKENQFMMYEKMF
jgi:hypothetical protein